MYQKIFVSEEVCAKYQTLRSHSREAWRGPHQGIEEILFLKANKQAAIVGMYKTDGTYWYDFADKNNLKIVWDDGFKSFLIAKSKSILNMFQRTKVMYKAGLINWRVYTIRLGRLLGYTKYQIKMFMENNNVK